MILKYTSYFLVKDKKKIKNIYINSFNKDEYVENMVAIRSSLGLKIAEIVSSSENIQRMLNNLYFDVLYKSRLAVEESKNTIEKVAEISNKIAENNLENDNDFDFDYDYA